MGADPRIRPLGVETPAQARALRSAMIDCAARFPTCARIFRDAGVDVRALPSADPFAVLRRLPITGADELKRASAEAPFADLRIVDTETSSGTTGGAAGGKKTRFITHRDDRAEHRFLARLMSVCGVSARDRVACVDTDPAAAMDGPLLPIGEYKGYGLSLITDIFAGVMTGALFGLSVFQDDRNFDVGHLMIAMDPAALMAKDDFERRLERLVAEVKNADPIDKARPVMLPGEVEFQRMEQRRQSDIPVSSETVAGLRALAEDIGVAFTL